MIKKKCIAREALCPKVAPLHKNNIQQDTKCDCFQRKSLVFASTYALALPVYFSLAGMNK